MHDHGTGSRQRAGRKINGLNQHWVMGKFVEKKILIENVLTTFGGTFEVQCQGLASRFREALRRANPDLSEDQMAPYDQSFADEIPDMARALGDAQVQAVEDSLTEEELLAWQTVMERPELLKFLQSYVRITPAVGDAVKMVFAERGPKAHLKSVERLFDELEM